MFLRYRKPRLRLLRAALLLGLAAAVVLQSAVLAGRCDEIRDSVLRLHVLANSDDPADQALKLRVRDRLLTDGAPLLTGAQTKEDAVCLTADHLEQLTALARDEIAEAGRDDPVSCRLETTYFETRTYDAVTLPAGYYTALRVVIGSGKGHNWWCVMFPPMCLPAAQEVTADEEPLDDLLTPGAANLAENGTKYEIRFKAVEVFQSVVKTLREWLQPTAVK